jgi:hypothetical protein
MILTRDM